MTKLSVKFKNESEKVGFDLEHRKKIKFNMSKYNAAVVKGQAYYQDLESTKQKASFIKQQTLTSLDKYLKKFESSFERNGGQVLWAVDDKEAQAQILKIIRTHKIKTVVKSKSMTTEEIELNDLLENNKVEVLETDLGEYIVQLAGEKPYHIVTPAMHKSKEDIAKLFNEKFNTPIDSTPEFLTNFVRQKLREKFIKADLGITGANFIIAEQGAVALTENEGNGLMTTSFPKIHIAIVGIEKVIPNINDLNLFWPLLAAHGTGQRISAYNSLFFGPKKNSETNGPDEMYVILLDNGRTNLLNQPDQKEALKCIRCGACLNACPVYKNIGGYTYNTTYSGPIGSVITPHFKGLEKYKHLSFASSLCGKCTEVCPVKIDLQKLLLYNRRDVVQKNYTTRLEKVMMYAYKKAMLNRKYLNMGSLKTKNKFLKKFGSKAWGPRRQIFELKESFNQQWKKSIA
ncbi:MAG: iron-sulfur cluster-binding protein [Chlorobi bacterium]|nr:iron-sulfur cluster-binding protein [Chlorobiota bacterium]